MSCFIFLFVINNISRCFAEQECKSGCGIKRQDSIRSESRISSNRDFEKVKNFNSSEKLSGKVCHDKNITSRRVPTRRVDLNFFCDDFCDLDKKPRDSPQRPCYIPVPCLKPCFLPPFCRPKHYGPFYNEHNSKPVKRNLKNLKPIRQKKPYNVCDLSHSIDDLIAYGNALFVSEMDCYIKKLLLDLIVRIHVNATDSTKQITALYDGSIRELEKIITAGSNALLAETIARLRESVCILLARVDTISKDITTRIKKIFESSKPTIEALNSEVALMKTQIDAAIFEELKRQSASVSSSFAALSSQPLFLINRIFENIENGLKQLATLQVNKLQAALFNDMRSIEIRAKVLVRRILERKTYKIKKLILDAYQNR